MPDPAALGRVRLTDETKVLVGSVSLNETTAALANGVLLSTGRGVYVSYAGALRPFWTMSQLRSDGYGGTAAVLVPSADL